MVDKVIRLTFANATLHIPAGSNMCIIADAAGNITVTTSNQEPTPQTDKRHEEDTAAGKLMDLTRRMEQWESELAQSRARETAKRDPIISALESFIAERCEVGTEFACTVREFLACFATFCRQKNFEKPQMPNTAYDATFARLGVLRMEESEGHRSEKWEGMFQGAFLTNIKVSLRWLFPSTEEETLVVFKETEPIYEHFVLPTSSVPPTIHNPDQNVFLRISRTEVPKWRRFLALNPSWQRVQDNVAYGHVKNVIHVFA